MVAQKQDTPVIVDCKVECRENKLDGMKTAFGTLSTATAEPQTHEHHLEQALPLPAKRLHCVW